MIFSTAINGPFDVLFVSRSMPCSMRRGDAHVDFVVKDNFQSCAGDPLLLCGELQRKIIIIVIFASKFVCGGAAGAVIVQVMTCRRING